MFNWKKALYFILFILLTFIFIGGCQKNNSQQANPDSVQFSKISTQNNKTDQQLANEAKDYLSKKKNVSSVFAVNTSKKLLVAVEIPHNMRFQLATIRKQLTKDLKEKYADYDVELSTDKKITIELEKLEQQLSNKNISEKDLKKKLKRLIQLSKEQT
ncbi:YhcN/YlaJ family sporulation lipoprotein [Virgibacillus sp. MG-45]|uniref:YhcN/YlaJ family sporulation lipoprotein n=1 Tax=Virgibacillus sp. MG-45 TaxID=3102791 RepID=UPI002EDB4A5A